ncbi:hypothetical protein D9M69_647790 [compost metagenome]
MLTPLSFSQAMLVSPRRNHSSSMKIDRVCSFFVVSSGKPLDKSKRIWRPNTPRVPVPVRSSRRTPFSRMSRSRFRYCHSGWSAGAAAVRASRSARATAAFIS